MTDTKKNTLTDIKDVPKAEWTKLSTKKIYFGHQSVGFNIINGISSLMKENANIQLNIVEVTEKTPSCDKGCFGHFRVGKNMDPNSKIESFKHFVENGPGKSADIAFFKFCYVDIHSQTDLTKLFDDYKTVMTELKNKFPDIKFIHVTTPLTSEPTGYKVIIKKIKTVIKKILGKPEISDNSVKQVFNEMLRTEYIGKEPVFDLAKIESTNAAGNGVFYKKNGKTIYSLAPEYTNDGGHLNENGQKIVAEQLLLFLVNL